MTTHTTAISNSFALSLCFRPLFAVPVVTAPAARQFLISRALPFPRIAHNTYIIIATCQSGLRPAGTAGAQQRDTFRQAWLLLDGILPPQQQVPEPSGTRGDVHVYTAVVRFLHHVAILPSRSAWVIKWCGGKKCVGHTGGCSVVGQLLHSEQVTAKCAEQKSRSH